MKKKLKDLTIKEIHDICEKYSPLCDNCPFVISGVYYDDDEHEECMFNVDPREYDCYYDTEIEIKEPEPWYYELGAMCEIFYEGEWIKGPIIEGERYKDGIITIATDKFESGFLWVPEVRTELYRKVRKTDEKLD